MNVLGLAFGAFLFGAAYLVLVAWVLTREDDNSKEIKKWKKN